MPYPQNVETALAVEALVRAEGSVPATIAVVEGRVCVGMSAPMVEQLARRSMPGVGGGAGGASSSGASSSSDPSTHSTASTTSSTREGVTKTSRRDLAAVVGLGRWGATTVSATMAVCHRVGIPVFVTGGIGGVHRGAESSTLWAVGVGVGPLAHPADA